MVLHSTKSKADKLWVPILPFLYTFGRGKNGFDLIGIKMSFDLIGIKVPAKRPDVSEVGLFIFL